MKRSVLNRAVNALRSTSAKQVFFKSHDGGSGFCAMGVIAHEAFGWQPVRYDGSGVSYGAMSVLYEAGFTSSNPTTSHHLDLMGVVQSLNDSGKLTFIQIADWLEANVTVTEEDELTVPDNLIDGWPPAHVPSEWQGLEVTA